MPGPSRSTSADANCGACPVAPYAVGALDCLVHGLDRRPAGRGVQMQALPEPSRRQLLRGAGGDAAADDAESRRGLELGDLGWRSGSRRLVRRADGRQEFRRGHGRVV